MQAEAIADVRLCKSIEVDGLKLDATAVVVRCDDGSCRLFIVPKP